MDSRAANAFDAEGLVCWRDPRPVAGRLPRLASAVGRVGVLRLAVWVLLIPFVSGAFYAATSASMPVCLALSAMALAAFAVAWSSLAHPAQLPARLRWLFPFGVVAAAALAFRALFSSPFGGLPAMGGGDLGQHVSLFDEMTPSSSS
jgi:hypothetical protein